MTPLPFATVVVPCRNEAAHIGACVASLLASDHPADRLEVLVCDGESDDGTTEIVAALAAGDARLRLLRNHARSTPAALNLGVRAARGACVLIAGAHSVYPPGYVSALVRRWVESGADVVGGVVETIPADGSARARGIAAALAHPLGVGNAHFRTGVREARWVDTVPFGCYGRAVFERVGLFDEELARNQDDELNARVLRAGGRLLLVPEVRVRYAARPTLAKLWRMYFQYGVYKPLVARKLGAIVTVRQLAPPALVAGLASAALLAALVPAARPAAAVPLLAYVLLLLAGGGSVARTAGLRVGACAALALATLHLSYGVGYLAGVARFLVMRRDAPAVTQLASSR